MSSYSLHNLEITDSIGDAGAIGRELRLDQRPPKSIPAVHKVISVQAANGTNPSSTQSTQFQIPNKDLMRAHTLYLKFRMTPNAAQAWSFAGSAGSAASLINSIQVQAGSNVIESLTRYDLWHNNVILAHGETADAINVESICAGSFPANAYPSQLNSVILSTGTAAVASAGSMYPASTTAYYDFTVPLYIGCFCPPNSEAFPLFALNSNVLITITWNTVARSIFQNTSGFTDWSLSQLELYYDSIAPTMEYYNEVRGHLAAGKMIQIPSQTYLNVQQADSQSLRFVMNMNVSSLDALFWGTVQDAEANTTSKYFAAAYNASYTTDDAIRREIYVDNQLVVNASKMLNVDSINYRELQKALCGTITSKSTLNPIVQGAGGNNTPGSNGTYRSQAYLLGLSLKNFVSEDVIMSGTPCNTLTVSIVDPAVPSNTAGTVQFYAVYSVLLLIDGSGNCSRIF